jgi:hypothetical protein
MQERELRSGRVESEKTSAEVRLESKLSKISTSSHKAESESSYFLKINLIMPKVNFKYILVDLSLKVRKFI